jgi:hypothetical protein
MRRFSGATGPETLGASRCYVYQASVAICHERVNLWYHVLSNICRLLYTYLPSLRQWLAVRPSWTNQRSLSLKVPIIPVSVNGSITYSAEVPCFAPRLCHAGLYRELA